MRGTATVRKDPDRIEQASEWIYDKYDDDDESDEARETDGGESSEEQPEAASKLWNVARYHSQQEWDEIDEIPSEADLKRELKNHERYSDLHSQSSSFETAEPSRDANELRSLSTARSRRAR